MTYSAEEGAKLSTVKNDSSGFYIPAGYADVVPALREAGVELKLNVFMANAPLRTMLADESSRAAAVTEIMAELGLDAGDTFAFVTNDYHIFRAGRIAGTDAACGVAATLPRSAYYDALQLNYYVREAFATGWLLLRGN